MPDDAPIAAGKEQSSPRTAAALSYRPGQDRAPKVVAVGRGATAERIIELAALNGLPVREDPELMAMLNAIDIGDEIPVEAFAAVAEILVYLYRVNTELGGMPADEKQER